MAAYFRGISLPFHIVEKAILKVGQGHFITAGAGAFRNFKLLGPLATYICNMIVIGVSVQLQQPTFRAYHCRFI